MQWLIVADAGGARFFEMDEDQRELTEKVNLVHPEARLRAADVYDDDPGRRSGATMNPHTPREDVEDEHFARLVATEAKKNHAHFDRLQIAAPPRFLGQLRKALDKSVARKVAGTLAKDLTHLKTHELKKAVGL
jgi:protein required for attachment to host cells